MYAACGVAGRAKTPSPAADLRSAGDLSPTRWGRGEELALPSTSLKRPATPHLAPTVWGRGRRGGDSRPTGEGVFTAQPDPSRPFVPPARRADTRWVTSRVSPRPPPAGR